MQVYKSKSIVPTVSNHEIATGCHGVQFISFESIVRLFRDAYSRDDDSVVIGYRVTDQGVEIILD